MKERKMKLTRKRGILLCALLSFLGGQVDGESSILVNADPNSRPDPNLTDHLIDFAAKQQAKAQPQQQQPQLATTNSQIVQSLNPPSKDQESPLSATKFDPSNFKSVYAAIRGHPNLRTFGALCELDGVREFVSLDKSEMTVFAPIDRSLGDIFALAKQRSISPSELAKHHIAPSLIVADESTQLPLKFHSLQQASPLYLGQAPDSADDKQLFVNNAKIIATYLIPIDEGDQTGSYQALHLIDAPLEFAYALRKQQVRQVDGRVRQSIQRNALNLDDLVNSPEQLSGLDEFARRFSDLTSQSSKDNLFATRPDKSLRDLNVNRILANARQFAPRLRNRLYATNETIASSQPSGQLSKSAQHQLNTYFLPISSNQLDTFLSGDLKLQPLFYEAHILAEQVLFTRQLGLGKAHSSLYNKFARNSKLYLNLAKTNQDQQQHQGPLLLQSKCSSTTPTNKQFVISENEPSSSLPECQLGLVSSEIVLANIPLANGVLHLIRKPIMVPDLSLINLLNDNANQLTEITQAIGSRTHHHHQQRSSDQLAPKLNRFRELISKNFALLSTINSNSNVTIFAPSDEAFDGLRYDLRALIMGDESLIPVHWDSAYRAQLLEKLLRRHLVVGTSIVTDDNESNSVTVTNEAGTQMRLKQSTAQNQEEDAVAQAQITIELINNHKDEAELEKHQLISDDSLSFKSNIIEADLIGKNGVLHIVDCVLGEPLETLHSLLKSLEIKQENNQHQGNPINELNELVKNQLLQHQNNLASSTQSSSDLINSLESLNNNNNVAQSLPSEKEIIAKTISQFLDEIQQQHQPKYQSLASSVNLTLQLGRLSGFGSDNLHQQSSEYSTSDNGLDLSWFKDTQRQLTLFAPNDLAWLRFMQAQPEIYKPIFNELLASQSPLSQMDTLKSLHNTQSISSSNDLSSSSQGANLASSSTGALSVAISRHSRALASQSSQRIKQILERHLVANARLQADSLNRLERVQTMRATIRLNDQPASELNAQLQTANLQPSSPMSAFAAFHSIVTGSSASMMQQQQQQQQAVVTSSKQIRKTISFDSIANIQFNPCCNYATSNGNLFVIDRVFALPDDGSYVQQTGSAPSASSSMSSLLGGQNSFLFEIFQTLIGQGYSQTPRNGPLILLATLICGILLLSLLATVLLIRRRRQHNKLAGHRQLESGLTSSSSANSTGSTSTTKSL